MAKKYLTAVFVTFIFIIGLAAGLILVRQSQEIRRRAQVPTGISISLIPPSSTIPKTQKATISIVFTNTSSPARDISLFASDVYLQFDPAVFSVSNLTCNSGFLSIPQIANVSGNKISLTCSAPGGAGSKIIAQGSQTTFGSFDITANGDGTSPITITGANVPDGTTFTDLSGNTGTGGSYTVAAVGGGTQPPGGGTQPPAPQGTPNPCGGSCGSNANCQSGLTCSNGFCRNPSCPGSTSCSCTPKPTTKPKPKVSPTATPSPTQIAVVIQTLTPTPFPTMTITPQAEPQGQTLGSILSKYWLLLLGFLLFLFAIILVVKSMGGGSSQPPIPPQQPPVQPPMAPPMMPGSPPVT